MLYKKNAEKTLNLELFKNPTSEYRATPFWAWNDKLNKEELCRQIEELKEMGLGGFHMHTRSGMATKYLSEEFMDLIKTCANKAEQENMLAWLYDEDRWPSGAAGGIVTKNPKYRIKEMYFTVEEDKEVKTRKAYSNYVLGKKEAYLNPVDDKTTGWLDGKNYLLAVYDIVLKPNGKLKSCKMIDVKDEAKGKKWFVYVRTRPSSGWYNGQTYVDTLSDEAMQEFIRVTYNAYNDAVGDKFGGVCPAIFTDEPQFTFKYRLPFATSEKSTFGTLLVNPWTTDFPTTFYNAYGYDLMEKLPEIIWDVEGVSKARYHYHDHICERFTNAFAKQCGEWCDAHNFYLTGHMVAEPTLESQTGRIGEAMRAYEYFGLPGIDMLCNHIELTTAKQTQSAVHQYGKEGFTSELYGVTNWDYDFRGHKFQGDWQAALGVTVRVPHLSWYSMRGSAKRDYPASIHYQSSWYKEYSYVENHFARLNTVLTRGTPDVKVAVLHPIESYWINYGPQNTSSEKCAQQQSNFDNVINWLLRGTIDFDYISESSIPKHYSCGKAKFNLGEMSYDTVVVAGFETIRSTTVKALDEFMANGGKVIFVGEKPTFVDAEISDGATSVYDKATKIAFTKDALLTALDDDRDITIRNSNGESTNSYLYNMRKDSDCKWLFIARCEEVAKTSHIITPDYCSEKLVISVKGKFNVKEYNTVSGEIKDVEYEIKDGNTIVYKELYSSDSLLLQLVKTADKEFSNVKNKFDVVKCEPSYVIDCKDKVDYALSEPNVLVLDMAKWSMDGKTYNDVEEILRIDVALRKQMNYPMADGKDVQPWAIEEEVIKDFAFLKFNFESEISAKCKLAAEALEEVVLNGKKVEIVKNGYFTDRHIFTIDLPKIKKGNNELIVKVPFGKRVSLENLFILGDFGVKVEGAKAKIVARENKIPFGAITQLGLPFYGAAITYNLPFETKDCDLTILAERYFGALITAELDGKDVGKIVYSPYKLEVKDVKAGKHNLKLTLYVSRVNCFGTLHNTSCGNWYGPDMWYTKDFDWAYEYQLRGNGILVSPKIEVYNK